MRRCLLLLALAATPQTSLADDAWQLTADPAYDAAPSWSPDGSQIAFTSWRSGNPDLWMIPAEGGAATQITTDPAPDAGPSWSPDGSMFVFASMRSGSNQLWVIPVTGGPAKQITFNTEGDTGPDWSPTEA